ncbi:MAG: 1-acyl-sn-glycerol-3-phosphate acyltransferase [Lachnospiraceae bacterium]|nr:1-acyl-sn-glycerol-3-phosphate acyltransferase [Lachnospiraceae bacterium]
MIRFVLVIAFVTCFLIASIPIFLVEWLIGKSHPDLRDRSSLRIVQWALRVIAWLAGIDLTVIGEEHVPKDVPVLYISNHRSYFDIVITYARCPRPTGYVSKKEMLKIPLLSRWMKFLHCQFLDRSDIRAGLKTILACIELVKKGISITIFPEGTRGKGKNELEMLPFHEGSFKVAAKSGCLIVPIAITGSSAIFEDHVPYVRRGHVTLEYGTPIDPAALSREDQKAIGKYVQGEIRRMLESHKASGI